MATVLITGGNGLIGRQLSRMLLDRGYDVSIVSRTPKPVYGCKVYTWNIEKHTIDDEAIDTADFIIHLAGENIGSKRWTKKRKEEIIDSRTLTAQLLFEKVKERKRDIRAYISASAAGYYGMVTSGKIFHESDSPSSDFTGVTCREWEEAGKMFQNAGIRTLFIRTGVVLAKESEALSKMALQVRMGFGSATGSGKQYFSWIHIDDLCRMYISAIENETIQGAYNATAPEYITNNGFMRKLSLVLRKPFWFPRIPALAMKMLFGEMSGLLLRGSRISSEKIRSTGFEFLYPDVESALKNILK
ncbi:MAG TPA: TIGR01777 family oxidoreductase [Paludibacteraceae bacterium]|nr:TIGR01777 family oxidoreductase [Paludibacteraceae bacterium]